MTQIDVILHEEYAVVLPYSHLSLRELETDLVPVLDDVPDGERMLFDTLFHAGNVPGRFVEARVNNQAIDWDTVKVIAVPAGSPLRKQMAAAIREEPELLDASILSSVQKKMLAAGLAI